ncbi:SUMO-activating enzyme subunit 2-like isoform X2 [Hylaeus volcanicus]|uniref:SUMO-activating enzyme subunit 2-like isoform X2 n=1 Tax=Hylaeus volcanicus TaxID=313075 RepID=UPI0023B7DDA7|nr:SUMO-activating enzyme subunit 2-like isoform X2 [Hylaeus volcanicus]
MGWPKKESISSISFEESLGLCFSKEKLNIIQNANLLVVGAGGIGCELLKNLIFSGFTQFDIIDLDTVDATNLNRQLLFNKSNVGESKAYAARDTLLKLCPKIKITSYYKNIKDSCFDVAFFNKYDIILNALDNNEARIYVNRICISLDIPLVDAGSSGYNGQVTPVIKNTTKCYECNPMPRQKTFPICTIRSTPHKAEHCIAWSKYFYELLFGEVKQDNLLLDIESDFWKDDNSENNASQKNVMEICYNTFQKIFDLDIRQHTHFIQPINSKILRPISTVNIFSADFELKSTYNFMTQSKEESNSQIPWSLDKCVYYFVESFCKSLLQRRQRKAFLVFNKDDPVCLNFITAASNLRMYNFNIPLMSCWEIKSIANAIIPAIASANAIVSALQASQAMNILWLKFASIKLSKKTSNFDLEKLNQHNIKHIWIKQFSIGPFLLLPDALEPPKSNCYVCQLKKLFIFLHDLQAWTLRHFLSILIQKELRYDKPIVQFKEKQICIYEPDIELDDSEMLHVYGVGRIFKKNRFVITVLGYCEWYAFIRRGSFVDSHAT